MAPMNRAERAKSYFDRLLASSNPKAELERIFRDIDSLVYASSEKPLDDAEKIRIIEELERLIKQLPYPIYENRSQTDLDYFQKSDTTASDNSDILDVISAMKRSKGGK
ncbi:hypothetical protein INR79_01675 [Vibrio sp. SCSIO 43132]|uniref:hypothetical protein n=1 Tax=Vibrio sp. SCSIO 43132 TaxID=2779363 RepID=UPI001CA8A0D6|nr:hypothetical protein [Vibrio sp. SCSIO 43132]UAB70661.1 hypothetical protein INR79_01675 [Vibrio sp. SCSIO 43132]